MGRARLRRTRILLLVLLAVALSACGAGPRSSPAEQRNVVLDSAEQPETLAVSDDGSVWFTTEFSSAVTRLGPKGQRTEYPLLHEDEIPYDLVRGPDGAIYAPTDHGVNRIDPRGAVSTFDVGWALAITADDDGLWYTSFGEPQVEHITTEGTVDGTIALPEHDEFVDRSGIAAGPNGTVWLTEASTGEGPPDAIASVTAGGSYARWPLPERRARPLRIASGPDGELWFTEERAHRIGRITDEGKISEYPLPLESAPTDIAAAADGALWFTTDTCIGRVTTKGQISMWPVAGARELVRIAAAPDGGFWLADHSGHALRHFTPPDPPVAPNDACHPPSIVLDADGMRAVVRYKRLDTFEDGEDFFTDIRVRIARHGKEVFSEAVPDHAPGYPDRDYTVYGYSSDVGARDLDGDGEAEVLLELNWNGTHCCSWSRLYRFDRAQRTYVPTTHFWGNAAASPKLRDLDRDGRPEFVSADDRFSELTGYAGAMRPIQIWSYDRGIFSDVTRSHPKSIERDAAELWRWYLQERGKGTVRYVLAAWAADQYLLGRPEAVERALSDAFARGELDPEFESTSAQDYLRMIRAFLRKTGYAPD